MQAGLTVITWNSQGNRGMDVAQVSASLGEYQPDLVLLQEIQRRQLRALGSAMAMPYARWRFKHWAVTVPAEGLGLLSRLPLDRVRTQVLAHPWQFWNWCRRVAVHFEVSTDGAVLRGANVHLGAGVSHDERARQARVLLGTTAGSELIGGDLNAEPDSVELQCCLDAGWRDAERRLHGLIPRPSTNWKPGPRTQAPTQRLDYLLVRDRVEVIEAFVPTDWRVWAPLSDHLPVIARIWG